MTVVRPSVLAAFVAALIGTVIGAVAGVWSLRQPAAGVSISASPASQRAMTSTTHAGAESSQLTQPRPPSTINIAPSSAGEDGRVLQRARTLARRPDVTALIALRDDVVRRANEGGTAGSSSIKRELDEIDRRLSEARLLRLKLDAQELRNAEPPTSVR